jgi:hypothetical protein
MFCAVFIEEGIIQALSMLLFLWKTNYPKAYINQQLIDFMPLSYERGCFLFYYQLQAFGWLEAVASHTLTFLVFYCEPFALLSIFYAIKHTLPLEKQYKHGVHNF